MLDIVISTLTDDEKRFIQDVAAVFAPWGMTRSAGRVFGYLLLKQAPTSLDQIAADLEMSKGGAWSTARMLERYGHVRSYSEPGSKRALFGPSDTFGAPLMDQASMLGAFGKLLQNGASTLATGAAAARLTEMGQFYLSMREILETAVRGLNARRGNEKV